MKKYHEIGDVAFDGDDLLINVEGKDHRIALASISSRLLTATPMERERFEVSPSGYGIHWPLLDEDLAIDSLLGISHSPSNTKGKAA